jgi:hypothetical protein
MWWQVRGIHKVFQNIKTFKESDTPHHPSLSPTCTL